MFRKNAKKMILIIINYFYCTSPKLVIKNTNVWKSE